MAETLKAALPTHLKPGSGNGNGDDETFARKHHGKTRSHMVSWSMRLARSTPFSSVSTLLGHPASWRWKML